MLETLAVLLGRHVRLRGTGWLLNALYPCRWDSPRYVQGVRSRADGLKIKVDTREPIDSQMVFLGGIPAGANRTGRQPCAARGTARGLAARRPLGSSSTQTERPSACRG